MAQDNHMTGVKKKALKISGYPDWTIDSVETKLECRRREEALPLTDEGGKPINEQPTKNYPVIVPT